MHCWYSHNHFFLAIFTYSFFLGHIHMFTYSYFFLAIFTCSHIPYFFLAIFIHSYLYILKYPLSVQFDLGHVINDTFYLFCILSSLHVHILLSNHIHFMWIVNIQNKMITYSRTFAGCLRACTRVCTFYTARLIFFHTSHSWDTGLTINC